MAKSKGYKGEKVGILFGDVLKKGRRRRGEEEDEKEKEKAEERGKEGEGKGKGRWRRRRRRGRRVTSRAPEIAFLTSPSSMC